MDDRTLTLVQFGDLHPEQRAELWGDDPDPFEMAGDRLYWQPKRRHVGLEDHAGRLVAAAGLVTTRVQAGGGPPREAIGLGGVIVARPHRGRGLARQIVGEALALGATLGPDLAMLFCLPSRMGLYERLGFSEIAPPVLVHQPSGAVPVALVVMWRTIRPGATLPTGRVSVLTLPF
jgi:GNAT superfamily N-acetyltransferase